MKEIVRVEWNQIDNQIAGIRFINYIGQKSQEFGNFNFVNLNQNEGR